MKGVRSNGPAPYRGEPSLEDAHAADAEDNAALMFDKFRKLPDAMLIKMHLAYAQNQNLTYADDRKKRRLQWGVTSTIVRERGYDPADLADLERRVS